MTNTRTSNPPTDSKNPPQNPAILRMFESAWFGQGDAFWHWIKTSAAQPYIDEFSASMAPPSPSDTFDFFADDEPDLLDPDHLDTLRQQIEHAYETSC